jgi:predicted Abi (CAAX) family protease
MQALAGKLRRAVATVPDAAAWRRTALEAAWLLPLLALAGFAGGFVAWGWTDDPGGLLRLALIAIVAPALGEELLFRAALLPAPREPAPAWRHVVPVLLFVAWHPPQALLFGPHWGEVVLNPWFLLAVALLGTALTRLYLATRSIWPCVALHWIVVVAWKAALGGPSPWPPG